MRTKSQGLLFIPLLLHYAWPDSCLWRFSRNVLAEFLWDAFVMKASKLSYPPRLTGSMLPLWWTKLQQTVWFAIRSAVQAWLPSTACICVEYCFGSVIENMTVICHWFHLQLNHSFEPYSLLWEITFLGHMRSSIPTPTVLFIWQNSSTLHEHFLVNSFHSK